MSGQQSDDPQYDTWQQAFMGHNLLSYAWKNRPSMNQLVPGYDPDESTVQKLMDYGSLPARLAVAPLLQGGDAFKQWMSGNQGPEVRQELLGSVLGLMGGGLTRATPGPASFGAWHGSRHLFEPEPGAPLGAFKPIEEVAHTGEGTQAFAYGHYVGGKKGTAESYMTAGMDDFRPEVKLDGQTYTINPRESSSPINAGIDALATNKGDHVTALRDLRTEARDLYNQTDFGLNEPAYRHMSDVEKQSLATDMRKANLRYAQTNLQAAKWIEDNHHRVEIGPDPGHLYQVAVKPDTHELLDWDKPLAEQSPQVRKIIEDNNFHTSSRSGEFTGREIYQNMADQMGPPAASKLLHDAGIPGVQFLDHGSRGIDVVPHKDTGDWAMRLGPGRTYSVHPTRAEAEAAAEEARTRNYVVFHHSNLKVIDRDGKHFGRLEPANETDPWSIVPQP